MINNSLRTYCTSAVSVIFYCYMLQNKQSHRPLVCNVMSHVVLFAYRITLNISTTQRVTKILQRNNVVNLGYLSNAITKISDKMSFLGHIKLVTCCYQFVSNLLHQTKT